MKKLIQHIIGILGIAILFLSIYGSASSKSNIKFATGTIKLTQKDDDIFTKSSLLNYMNSTKEPTIVLRVPNQIDKIVEENKYSSNTIYNSIEKEFAKANFIVRDRALYQKVIEQQVQDYSKIKELTNTDLILEFINFDKVSYNTNKYTDKKGKQKLNDATLTLVGYKIEFKLIKVSDNDLVGSYTFHTTPCTSGCVYSFDNFGNIYSPKEKGKSITKPYEFISSDALEEFIKLSTSKLINKMRNQ